MKPDVFSVLSFNVNGQLRFGWEHRAPAIGAVLKKSSADIIGFQEFGTTNWQAYESYLPGYELYPGLEAGDILINPIAWRSERFCCDSRHTYWLSETPDQFSKGWDGSERGVSTLKLKDMETGREVVHFNAHLDNVGEQARVKGTKQILALVEALDSDVSVIITGDFNCSPYLPHERSAYTRTPYDLLIAAGFSDAWAVANPGASIPSTFHGYRGTEYVADEFGTWHTDWVMVRGLKVEDYAIIRELEDDKLPSDHYPVRVTLEYIS